jgi:hypothetical protein
VVLPAQPDADAGLESYHQFFDASIHFQHLRESEPGALAMVGNHSSEVTIAGTVLPADAQVVDGVPVRLGVPNVFVLKLDQDDRVPWVRAQDWGDTTFISGLGSLPSGEVFIGGQARVDDVALDAPDLEYDFVIRKLRAD